MWKKLILATCIQDLVLLVNTLLINTPKIVWVVNQELHFVTKLSFYHPRQDFSTNLERASHPFLVKNHSLKFVDANSHLSCFTLSWKPPRYILEVLIWLSQKNNIICKKWRWNPMVPKLDPSSPWLRLEILSIRLMYRTSVNVKPSQSPTCTRNRSDLLPAMWTKLLLW